CRIRFGVQTVGKRDGAFHGELRAGADREMRRGGGIAQQHDVVKTPALAKHAIEVEPSRAAQMLGIRHQRIATKVSGKYFFASSDCSRAVRRIETRFSPGVFRALHDESRGVRVELISVR